MATIIHQEPRLIRSVTGFHSERIIGTRRALLRNSKGSLKFAVKSYECQVLSVFKTLSLQILQFYGASWNENE